MKNIINLIITLVITISATNTLAQKSNVDNKNINIEFSFEQPDFNYPQSVITDASDELEKALKLNDGERIVLALIQSSLAKSMISTDSLPTIIDEIEHFANTEKDECIKSTLFLLEAKILNSYYCNNKYKLSSRTSLNTTPSSVFEWNASQFKNKISLLLNQALNYKKKLINTPVSDYKKIVKINDESVNIYPTMFDFIAYQSIEIYKSWDIKSFRNIFVNTPLNETNYSEEVNSIYKTLLSSHKNGSLPYINAICEKEIFNNSIKTDFLDNSAMQLKLSSLYDEYKNNPNVAPIILKLEGSDKKLYNIYSNYIEQYPQSIFTPTIKSKKLNLEKRSATLSFERFVTTADSIKIECQAENTNNIELAIYTTENADYIRSNKFMKNKPVATHTFSIKGVIPFSDTIHITIPPLDYGCYTIVANSIDQNGNKEELSTNYGYNSFIVTDISSFSICNRSEKTRQVFAVDAITGKPLSGVRIASKPINKKLKKLNEISTEDGSINVPNSNYRYFDFIKGSDNCYSWNYYSYFYNQNDTSFQYNCNIYTDFAIYRPGDTIKMAAVCNRTNVFKKELATNLKVKATLFDANFDSISSVSLITDEMGRITHNFPIPTNRLNGEFSIVLANEGNGVQLANHRIAISEFKTPTFFIEFIEEKHSYPEDGNITLQGIVKTFSGMPLADVSVFCELQKASLYSDFSSIANTTISTDEMGAFSISFSASATKNYNKHNRYIFDCYRIVATATDNVGETQTANSKTFYIGKAIVMNWNGDNTISSDALQSVKLPISLISYEENAPQSYPCILRLCDTYGKEVATIPFESENPTFDFSAIASGEYSINAWLKSDTTIRIQQNYKLILYRPSDTESPINSALWTPVKTIKNAPGANGTILIGSSFDNTPVYYTVCYLDKILRQGWITLRKGLSHFNYTMPKEMLDGERIIISLYNIHNNVKQSYEISVYAEEDKPQATLSIESFRNLITPNSHEKWTLHLAIDGKPVANAAIISAMTDKAINALKNNEWKFYHKNLTRSTQTSFYSPYSVGKASNHFQWNTEIELQIKNLGTLPVFNIPELNLYNQSYFASSIRVRGTGIVYAKATNADSVNESYFEAEQSLLYQDKNLDITESASDKNSSAVSIRTENVRTVFWQPLLITDERGNASIEFDVPNMNTTWMLQAVGYTQDVNSATILKDIVASKPIMVSPNLPRFLRQGDKATLMASVQNATDSTQRCTIFIELFNPLNNEIYSRSSFLSIILKHHSSPVSIDYEVPDSINVLGVKVWASNGTFSDGEQDIVPILPSVSPIVETKPFYITPEESDFTIDLPTFPENARITFEYCDNPIWYVATALPSINSNDNTTVTQIVHSIFANLVAQKVATDNPEIAQALTYWKDNQQDSVLISMLSKNQDIKIGNLLASPWIKDSEEQTLRMSQLNNLFDKDKVQVATDILIQKLAELQLHDGGFVWYKYPNATSSVHTTLSVLQVLGRIKALNAISDNNKLNDIIAKAIKYIDNELIKLYEQQKNKSDYSGYLQFAYTRSLFLYVPINKNAENLYEKISQSLAKEWKEMNIANKAFTAITLTNFGMIDQARPILESINQFSIYNPNTGRYWDNIQNDWYQFYSKVSITSLILQAYHLIEPNATEIDQIRQWLLLEKQTSDWGNSSLAAEAVCAILNTGTNWLKVVQTPTINLNGSNLETTKIDKILGYEKIQLNIENSTTKNTINIKRNGNNPSWGAIYCQYNAQMNSVKAASTNELSIRKELINYSDNDTIKIGDKIQIRLIVKNSKELEYVTITDERPACFEPADQISGYRYEDGIGYYLETKDSETNLFFNYLPKGTHIITYDAYVTNTGEFNNGVATIQCQYAPQITAHTAGNTISVK